jgi:hypothetical protein
VPVDELPLAINAPVDVGDPEHPVAHRAAIDADMAALKADRVGQVPAGGDDGVLYVHDIGAAKAASGRAIIALVFRCKIITRGDLRASDEATAFRWATEADIGELADHAYAVRDALHGEHPPAIRQHDGVQLL